MVRLRILPLNQIRAHFRFVHCAKGAPACRDYEKTGEDLFAYLDDGQTTGRAPTKYDLMIKYKNYKGTGPHHPTNTFVRADEVIE